MKCTFCKGTGELKDILRNKTITCVICAGTGISNQIKIREELAYQWCRLNDPDSFYHNTWSKDKIAGGMRTIESFIEKKYLLLEWKTYIADKKRGVTLREKINKEMIVWD